MHPRQERQLAIGRQRRLRLVEDIEPPASEPFSEQGEEALAVRLLVQAADAISGSRPGARREAFETYVKRLEGLEKIASSYKGVDRVFAIQAGREIRVIVNPDDVDDARMQSLTEEIARRVETELQYPGQIKVVAIREKRAMDIAR